MRLYVNCPDTRQRIYLSLVVEKRSQVYESFTVQCPYDGKVHQYRREEVNTEPSFGSSIGGTLVGGLIGAIVGGPLGAILLGGAGLVIGNNADEEEKRRVQRFEED